MRRSTFFVPPLLALGLLPCSGLGAAEPGAAQHVMVKASQVQWGKGPPALPPGVQAAVLSGNPAEPGAFAIRLKAPAGYRIPRHWHPTDEHVTVIEGAVTFSMGEAADAHSTTFGAGDYVLLPAQMQHEATFEGGAVVQVQSTGPFEVHYVDAGDDPRQQQPPDVEEGAEPTP